MAGRRGEGHAILCKGYRLQPNHPGILSVLEDLGRRRRPPLPFLSRANPINVLLGRMSRGAAGER
jgi:hypothetical protein